MGDDPKKESDQTPFLQRKRTTLILSAVVALIAGMMALNSIRMSEVNAGEVGVMVDNWSGKVEVIGTAGTVFYNGWLSSFYTLDRTQQDVHMSGDPRQGDLRTVDDVSITTRDGYSVNVDLTIYYALDIDGSDEAQAKTIKNVMFESGRKDAYKKKWIRDYARAICRYVFGELTTEEFYVAKLRSDKQDESLAMLNKFLKPRGIVVTQINVQEFHFDKEYEGLIAEKKNADQAVERLGAELKAKEKEMITEVKRANNKKDTTLAGYELELQQFVIEAKGKATQLVKQAEAQAERIVQKVEAEKFQYDQEAAAILAERQAEAKGLLKRVTALEGPGGREMVMRAYAEKLKGLKIKGKPFATGDLVSPVELREAKRR